GLAPDPLGSPPTPTERHGALHGADRPPAGRLDPHRGRAVVSGPGHPRAVSLLGPHALDRRRGIRRESAVARDLARPRHQPRRVRDEPARRRAARHARPPPTRLLTQVAPTVNSARRTLRPA